MIKATSISHHFHDAADTITLDKTARHRRRIKLTSDGGLEFLLDLADARLLRHGDGLVLEDGRIIEVRSEPEDLLKVTAQNPQHLTTLAWQIGNRHIPAQVLPDGILVAYDHVIADMLVGLGANVEPIKAPFDPEGGAYDGGGHSHHTHDHSHD